MITIIDYGMGNLGSIQNMLSRLGYQVEITSDVDIIRNAEKLILPGVGAFDQAMINLNKHDFIPALNKRVVEEGTPLLGICLGMQLLTNGSEEGQLKGLGWIDAQTLRFNFGSDQKLRVPHMGWNTLTVRQKSCLFKEMYEDARFYFVHSYYVKCKSQKSVLATSNYGIDFAAGIMKDNIYGLQFHPEKSHKFGMQIFRNFSELC